VNQKTLMTCSIPLDRDGVHYGYLHVPHSVHRSAYGRIPIPIAVAKRGVGPTVLLTGGVHGDEYEGPVFLSDLARALGALDLSGRLIVLPSVNHPAYLAGTRTSPIDGVNLNRCFPGSRNGSVTEMIAHFVSSELLPLTDYVIDFHAGGSSLQYLPIILAPTETDEGRRRDVEALVEALRPERVAYYDSRAALNGDDRVFGAAAAAHGCHYLNSELGGAGTIDLNGLALLEGGVQRVLHRVGLLAGVPNNPTSSAPIRRLTLSDPGLYAYAPCNGVFRPAFRLGDDVAPGALAGAIYDPQEPWASPRLVPFQAGGFAICIRACSQVIAGDCLGHLAHDLA
jgi:predicted deacylase